MRYSKAFGYTANFTLYLCFVSSGSCRLCRLSIPERDLKVREEQVELDQEALAASVNFCEETGNVPFSRSEIRFFKA